MNIRDKDLYQDVKNNISMANLRKLIDNKGLLTTKVAMEARVSNSTINSYITGYKLPSLMTLVSMADFLNCNIDYLLGRTDNPIKISEMDKVTDDSELNLLFHNISSLPKEKQQLVIAYVKGILNS